MTGSKLYTRNGDSGQTRLGTGRSVPKTNGTLEVTGNVDELIASIGVAKAGLPENETVLISSLSDLQKELLLLKEDLGSFGSVHNIKQTHVDNLEQKIDAYAPCAAYKDESLTPGQSKSSAALDLARMVARRMERSLSKAGLPSQLHRKYTNRLSDYLYAAARYMELRESIEVKLRRELGMSEALQEAPEAPVFTEKPLPLRLAKELAERVEAEAEKEGLRLVIAVVSAEGRPVLVHAMDDAFIASYDIAVNKAFTAVSLKMPTKELAELCKPGGSLYGLQHTNGGRIVIFGGGVPLTDNEGRIIGGFAVSGSTAEVDTRMGDLGKEIFDQIKGGRIFGNH